MTGTAEVSEATGIRPDVRRRRVFYIPGFDPAPPRRYREMYRREGAEQARISGYRLSQSTLAGRPNGWLVTTEMEGAATAAEVEVLVWSDIVKASMAQGIVATYAQLAHTAWVYAGSGALWRVARLRKGPTIAALYPVAVLVAQLLLSLVAGYGLASGIARALPAPLGLLAGGLAGAVLLVAMLQLFRRYDGLILAHYLMHDYAYTARLRGAYPSGLSERMAAFGRQIRAALEEDVDEVLVVGHSSGAILGVTVLADLIRAGLPAGHPPLGFLTLGQMVPMISFLPEAKRLRADLHYLSQRDEVTWVDVTAPGDGCAFALCDPVAVSGVAPKAGKRWPLVISAAFSQTLSPETWARLRRRWFTLHFQYMGAFDRPGDYDYFRITAGPLTLATRFAGRAPSPSRVEVAHSGYRSMA
ncbi:MAG: hypothetical protein RIR62_574 [Pseudomonadota bacterium]